MIGIIRATADGVQAVQRFSGLRRQRGRSRVLGSGPATDADGRHEEQDPRAALALHDALVAAKLVVDLRAQPDVALGAEAVPGLGHRQALAVLRHPLEEREDAGRHSCRDLRALGARLLEFLLGRHAVGLHLLEAAPSAPPGPT